MLTGGMLKD